MTDKTKLPPCKIDPAHIPFLNAIASMIAAKLLTEHHERQRARSEGAADAAREDQEVISATPSTKRR